MNDLTPRRPMLLALLAAALLCLVAAPSVLLAQDDPAPADDAPTTTSPTAADDATDDPTTAEPTDEQRIRLLLSAYDTFPTREELDAVTTDVPDVLIAIFNDPTARASLKARAIDAMGYYDDDTTRQFLEHLLDNAETDGVPEGHIHRALTAYAKARGEASLTVIEPFLTHTNEQLRITAGVALAKSAGPAGRRVLEKRIPLEPSDLVREKIENGLHAAP